MTNVTTFSCDCCAGSHQCFLKYKRSWHTCTGADGTWSNDLPVGTALGRSGTNCGGYDPPVFVSSLCQDAAPSPFINYYYNDPGDCLGALIWLLPDVGGSCTNTATCDALSNTNSANINPMFGTDGATVVLPTCAPPPCFNCVDDCCASYTATIAGAGCLNGSYAMPQFGAAHGDVCQWEYVVGGETPTQGATLSPGSDLVSGFSGWIFAIDHTANPSCTCRVFLIFGQTLTCQCPTPTGWTFLHGSTDCDGLDLSGASLSIACG